MSKAFASQAVYCAGPHQFRGFLQEFRRPAMNADLRHAFRFLRHLHHPPSFGYGQ